MGTELTESMPSPCSFTGRDSMMKGVRRSVVEVFRDVWWGWENVGHEADDTDAIRELVCQRRPKSRWVGFGCLPGRN